MYFNFLTNKMSNIYANLPDNPLVKYVALSCWDHTAGPVAKCVWKSENQQPLPDAHAKMITQLLLKSEVDRQCDSSYIDCNLLSLPSIGYLISCFLFTGACKHGLRVYALSLIMPLDKETDYYRWRKVIECYTVHHLYFYRVSLEQGVRALSMEKSNEILHKIPHDLAHLVNRMSTTCLSLNEPQIKIEDTFFSHESHREIDKIQLDIVLTRMMLAYGRVLVIGDKHQQSTVNKWVKTLSLLLNESDRYNCFITANDIRDPDDTMDLSIPDLPIPGAMIQGIIMPNKVFNEMKNELIYSLYTSDYPKMVLRIGKHDLCKLSLTSSTLYRHRELMQNFMRAKLERYYAPSQQSLNAYESLQKEVINSFERIPMSRVKANFVTNFCQQLSNPKISNSARVAFVHQHRLFLTAAVNALVQFFTYDKNKHDSVRVERYQLLSSVDSRLVACAAETMYPGICMDLEDGSDVMDKFSQVVDEI